MLAIRTFRMKKFDNQGPSTALKLNPNSAEPIDCAPPCRCISQRIPLKNIFSFTANQHKINF